MLRLPFASVILRSRRSGVSEHGSRVLWRKSSHHHSSRLFAGSTSSKTREDAVHPRAKAILDFWLSEKWSSAAWDDFPEQQQQLWFSGKPEVDATIRQHFAGDLKDITAGKLEHWLTNPRNTLAGVILMDQLARNIHRGLPSAFALGQKSVTWAACLLDSCEAVSFPVIHRVWLSMPYLHSEKLEDQERSVMLQSAYLAEVQGNKAANPALLAHLESAVRFAKSHRDIIAQWGRFPHRNAILNRRSTEEELAGLASGSILRF